MRMVCVCALVLWAGVGLWACEGQGGQEVSPEPAQGAQADASAATAGDEPFKQVAADPSALLEMPDWPEPPPSSGGGEQNLRVQVQLGHGEPVVAVAMDADGTLGASLDGAGRVCVWHVPSGRLLRTWLTDSAQTVAVSADGNWVATAGKMGAVVSAAADGAVVWRDPTSMTRPSLRFGPHDDVLVVAHSKGASSHRIGSWEVAARFDDPQYTQHQVLNVTDDGRVLTSVKVGRARQWKLCLWGKGAQTQPDCRWQVDRWPHAAAFLSDGSLVAALGDRYMAVLSPDGAERHRWSDPNFQNGHIQAMSSDGTRAYNARGAWDSLTGEVQWFKGRSPAMETPVAADQLGETLLVANKRGLLRVDLSTGTFTDPFGSSPDVALDADTSADGRFLAVAYKDNRVAVWSVTGGKLLWLLQGPPQLGSIAIKGGPEPLLALVTRDNVSIVAPSTGQTLAQTSASRLKDIDFDPKGQQLALLGQHLEVWSWSDDTRETILYDTSRAKTAAFWGPGGQMALHTGKKSLTITRQAAEPREINLRRGQPNPATLHWHAPSGQLALFGRYGTVQLLAIGDEAIGAGRMKPPFEHRRPVNGTLWGDTEAVGAALVDGDGHIWRLRRGQNVHSRSLERAKVAPKWLLKGEKGQVVIVDGAGHVEVWANGGDERRWSGTIAAKTSPIVWSKGQIAGETLALEAFSHLVDGSRPRHWTESHRKRLISADKLASLASYNPLKSSKPSKPSLNATAQAATAPQNDDKAFAGPTRKTILGFEHGPTGKKSQGAARIIRPLVFDHQWMAQDEGQTRFIGDVGGHEPIKALRWRLNAGPWQPLKALTKEEGGQGDYRISSSCRRGRCWTLQHPLVHGEHMLEVQAQGSKGRWSGAAYLLVHWSDIQFSHDSASRLPMLAEPGKPIPTKVSFNTSERVVGVEVMIECERRGRRFVPLEPSGDASGSGVQSFSGELVFEGPEQDCQIRPVVALEGRGLRPGLWRTVRVRKPLTDDLIAAQEKIMEKVMSMRDAALKRGRSNDAQIVRYLQRHPMVRVVTHGEGYDIFFETQGGVGSVLPSFEHEQAHRNEEVPTFSRNKAGEVVGSDGRPLGELFKKALENKKKRETQEKGEDGGGR